MPPYPRLSHREALDILRVDHDLEVAFGVGLADEEEALLSRRFQSPFWLVGIPRSIEPFPYTVDPLDNEVTMTADLIAPDGYGELLGVAEKTHEPAMLQERMAEKGKLNNPRYRWISELRDVGCVPHGGFGWGLSGFFGGCCKRAMSASSLPSLE